jgi:hypothetical protein
MALDDATPNDPAEVAHRRRNRLGIEEWLLPGEPLSLLARFAAVAFASVILGAILPGLVAQRSHVFYRLSTEQLVLSQSQHQDLRPLLDQWNSEQEQYRKQLDALDAQAMHHRKRLRPGSPYLISSSLSAFGTQPYPR